MQSRTNTGMRLTETALAKIDAAGKRLGRSRAAVVELLAMMHADGLNGDTMIPASAIPGDTRAPKKSGKKKK